MMKNYNLKKDGFYIMMVALKKRDLLTCYKRPVQKYHTFNL